MKPRVVIIGGGAAGLMAAATLVEADAFREIHIYDKNASLGVKVLISGGGRCNVTTNINDIRVLLQRYPRGGRFLRHALMHFTPQMMVEWVEAHGVPLKTEVDGRVFPRSDRAIDVISIFLSTLKRENVQIHFKNPVQHVDRLSDGTFEVTSSEGRVIADVVIVTSGGQAYRNTGSTGDGYAIAESLGHSITKLAPSLNAFIAQESWLVDLAGVSWHDAGLTIMGTSETFISRGPFVFTHNGVSGPAVFAISAEAAWEHISRERPRAMLIDFFPMKNNDELDQLLRRHLESHGGKTIVNLLDELLPPSLARIIVERAGLRADLHAARVSREDRKKIFDLLRGFSITLVGQRPGEEFVTAGGIDTTEIYTTTMMSKKVPGLYFAGEIINVDGYTGGFNLQSAWATGRLAGLSIAASVS